MCHRSSRGAERREGRKQQNERDKTFSVQLLNRPQKGIELQKWNAKEKTSLLIVGE
jgi:hypothetical protein